mgnify:CR=1 FL=1
MQKEKVAKKYQQDSHNPYKIPLPRRKVSLMPFIQAREIGGVKTEESLVDQTFF